MKVLKTTTGYTNPAANPSTINVLGSTALKVCQLRPMNLVSLKYCL